MDLGLRNRVVLVTGASGAIGGAISRRLAAEGAKLALGYHSRKDAAEQLAAELRDAGATAQAFEHDLEDPATIAAAVAAIETALGGVEVLVAAAVSWPRWPPHAPTSFEPTPADVWHQQLRDNAEGTAHTVQAVLPGMQARGWGRIVIISTTLAEDGFAGMEAYGAAKAALHGLSRSLAHGVGRMGVLVNIVEPGLVPTASNAQTMPDALAMVAGITPTGRLSTAEDVAGVVTFLASAANTNVTGAAVRVSGGL